ncbi:MULTISPECIES: hypothetical protein [Methylocaldum]|jgi:hypothetical protein|uniref:hypothetical protein n=1 Tax=Methylocaldum sp. GT1TLB TaxID=3438965 RepID=UPI0012EBDDA7|nr:hypothetical protein [Methylocaldum sp. BRCS4]
MLNVFNFRDTLIEGYRTFSRSFVRIEVTDIRDEVERQYAEGRYWPEPLIQINPNYQRKGTVQQLAAEGVPAAPAPPVRLRVPPRTLPMMAGETVALALRGSSQSQWHSDGSVARPLERTSSGTG